MLTAIAPTDRQVNSHNRLPQDETLVSDEEISRRLLSIRSGWTVTERIERRREAERRFSELLNVLTAA
jgi:hypothetical protein